ncbi:MAG: mucoidy inhibitor MuiA family protein [Myxococcales bacterium]|nr:mucoidy inhibitor MuiA family protein [Myxococcales bacterium]MCB9647450.1 mucoidy inhibitor MuiA family protein [Deltaproteobacteria bacterium]
MMLATQLILTMAAAGPAASPVDRVTVFSDRAEVTRVLRGTCKGESQGFTFNGLPTSLDARTLRGEATGRAVVEGLTSRVVPVEENTDDRRVALARELDKLGDDMKAIQAEIANLNERQATANGYGSMFRGLMQEQMRDPRPDEKGWRRALGFFASEDLSSREGMVKKNIEARTLGRRMEQLQRELSALGGVQATSQYEVTVAVRCAGENSATVRLSYVVPGATWHPEYDLRFLPASKSGVGKGQAVLTVSAVVQQATGEDWEDVEVLLSTAKPRLGAEAPYPAPLWITGYDAGKAKVMVQGTEDRASVAPSGGAAANQGPRSADLDDGGKSFTLKLPHRATVRADGRPYWMPVDETKGAATARRIAIPKASGYVFRAVKLDNPAAYPLMAGKLHTFRGDAYVGATALEYTAPGAPMEVSLGIDESFRVERSVMHEMNREPKLFEGRRRFERHYRIRVFNQTNAKGTVEVRENIPVSKDEHIQVSMDKKVTTRGVMVDEHRGFVTFEVPVAQDKSAAVDLAYTISLPEDWAVR